MLPNPLTLEEQAALPEIRPRWLAHLGAWVGVGVFVGLALLQRRSLDWLDPIVTGWDLPWGLSIAFLPVAFAVPWAIIAPVLFRVGYHWGTVLLLAVFPIASPFVGWAVGFRLVRIPYRDWRPSPQQRPSVRPMLGTGYHVLQGDLDRLTEQRQRAMA